MCVICFCSAIIGRIATTIRGCGDPLMGIYARTYLTIVSFRHTNVEKDIDPAIYGMLDDYLFSFTSFKVCALMCHFPPSLLPSLLFGSYLTFTSMLLSLFTLFGRYFNAVFSHHKRCFVAISMLFSVTISVDFNHHQCCFVAIAMLFSVTISAVSSLFQCCFSQCCFQSP